jgi:hypothetical protein
MKATRRSSKASTLSKGLAWLLLLVILAGCNPAPASTVEPAPSQPANLPLTATTGPQPTATSEPAPTAAVQPDQALSFPKIDRRPMRASWTLAPLTELPHFNPSSSNPFELDLRTLNIADLDLSDRLDDLLYFTFDDGTTWPPAERLPAGFDPERIMELGKNPGLGLRELHSRGITGRGVGLAIIDQPLLVGHQEYVEQLRLYEEINVNSSIEAQMHGPAVASIAVGKTTGVAPEADLYYIGSWPGDWDASTNKFTYNFSYFAQAIRRVLEINRQLTADRKIRVITIQNGWSSDRQGYADISEAVEQARAEGLLVVSSSLAETFGFHFHGLGRDPLADPDDFTVYRPGIFWMQEFLSRAYLPESLLVPMDSRAAASPMGADEYAFYRQGGWSWAIPYIGGMYALAAQVDPEITPERFWQAAMETGRTIEFEQDGRPYSLGPILDPAALIEALE